MTALAVGVDATPAPPRVRFDHKPALDGLRGLAVLSVVLYHVSKGKDAGPLSGVVTGGYLGVDIFFVLSGYLITSLLLVDHANRGRVVSVDFWIRRIRRLLPPVLVLMLLVSVYALVTADPWMLGGIRREGLATLFYAQNWYLIFGHPGGGNLGHTWSLAIEEQWYLVWPFALAGLLVLVRHRWDALVAAIAALALASAAWMSLLASRGEFHRAHSGTDTRASELLIGAGLAVVMLHMSTPRRQGSRVALEAAGLTALGALVVLMFVVDENSGLFLLHGGYLLVALLSAIVVAACVQGGSPLLRRGLSIAALTSLGLISYGVYLYHLPLIVWLTPATVGMGGAPLFAVRMLVILAVSIASYKLIEMPIRRRPLRRRSALLVVPALAAAAALLWVSTAGGHTETVVDRVAAYTGSAADAAPRGSSRVLVVGDLGVYALARAGGQIHDEQSFRGLAMSLLVCDGMPGRPLVPGAGSPSLQCPWHDIVHAEVDGFAPHVTVLALGTWLGQRRLIDGVVLAPGSPQLAAAYRTRLGEMQRVLQRGGRALVLVSPECSLPAATPPSVRAWIDGVWRSFAESRPGAVTYADPQGGPCPPAAAGAALRGPTGAFTPAGAAAMWKWIVSWAHLPDSVS